MILAHRFRGYLPIVIDIETAGFNPRRNPLLEIAAVILDMDSAGNLFRTETIEHHIVPFLNSELDPKALAFTGIDPFHPFRFAISEAEALRNIYQKIRQKMKEVKCQRAVLVGHNPSFDLSFLKAAEYRNQIKRSPFHPFTTFDTATLGALAVGQTVLAKATAAAGIEFDQKEAHSAIYDAERTADLFCHIINRWQLLNGWPCAPKEKVPT